MARALDRDFARGNRPGARMNGAVSPNSSLARYSGMMKNILLLAGAAALAATASPALAKQGPKHGKHHRGHAAMSHCPPGLAKKNNGCLPPGQAKKLYNIGQRLPYGFNGYTPYDRIPYDMRRQYGLDPYGRYIYDQNYLYRVDPATRIVSQILTAIIR